MPKSTSLTVISIDIWLINENLMYMYYCLCVGWNSFVYFYTSEHTWYIEFWSQIMILSTMLFTMIWKYLGHLKAENDLVNYLVHTDVQR